MANLLAPVAKAKFFDNNGRPAAGYKLFSYEAGTNTKLATYTDETTGTPNSNPVVLDYRGEANVWVPPNVAYKFVFAPPTDTDPPTAPIWTVDDIVDSQLVTLWGGVDTGIANAYVLNFTANFTGYEDGIVIYWLPANSNTAASSINVNGLGPVAITNQDGSALNAGAIQVNQIAQIMYLGTGFVLLSSQQVSTTGIFSGSLTGFASPQPIPISYTRQGSIVTLRAGGSVAAVSNSSSMTLSGLPASLRPLEDRSALSGNIRNNSTDGWLCNVLVDNATGLLTFELFSSGTFGASSFTAAGAKGIVAGWSITYTL